MLLHDGLYLLDLRVALARRSIPVLEQWVHGFQHLLPWAGLAGLREKLAQEMRSCSPSRLRARLRAA